MAFVYKHNSHENPFWNNKMCIQIAPCTKVPRANIILSPIFMENHIKAIRRLHKMHELILQEKTGTPDEFATRIQVSRRQLYNILEHLNDHGASIRYSRARKTFYYGNKGVFDISSILQSYTTAPPPEERVKPQ